MGSHDHAARASVGPSEIRIERVQIATDGGVTVDLTPFDGAVSLTRQQLGALVGTVAAQVWRAARREAPARVASTAEPSRR